MTRGSGGPGGQLPMRWLLIATVAAAVFAFGVNYPRHAVALGLTVAVVALLHTITGEG
ncbi:hypothetical protein ACFY5F_29740 [Streptomyces sp. NPDC013161]|uniref:hypothetical protein n=1 Tax=Streptomyces sp. NPDC013161 TaxID=3364862 RepID=UPI0036A115D2